MTMGVWAQDKASKISRLLYGEAKESSARDGTSLTHTTNAHSRTLCSCLIVFTILVP